MVAPAAFFFLLLLLSLLLVFRPAAAAALGRANTPVTISNVDYRRNVTGDIMDAHDGTYNQWTPGGPWYYYAMGYGSCQQGQDLCNGHCGYGYSWIGVWRSPDMSNGSWMLVREARDDTWPDCIYFRVHTVFNAQTMKYVMWANLNGNENDYAVGTSDTPEGPFTFVHGIKAGRIGAHGGDFDIFVDDDGAAFLIYTAVSGGHTMAVERLTDDYLRSAATSSGPTNVSSGVFGIKFVEAPAMFKRKNVYYALFGNCCCFCSKGSGIGVYTASHPLGPWKYHNNVGCLANVTLTNGCGCGMDHSFVGGGDSSKATDKGAAAAATLSALSGDDQSADGTCSFYGDSLTKAQQNFVIQIPQADGSTQYVWTGDRWMSAPDGDKAHDLQYWSVLQFQNVQGIDLPVQFAWQDEITINV